jgi:PAS domain S-box-containing protein
LEQVPFGSHTLDSDGTYLTINAQELAWIGRSRDEAVGRIKFTDQLTPDSREKFQNYFPRFIKSPFVESLELELVGSDGVIRHVSLYIAAIRDAGRNLINYRSVLYDITERIQAEQALRESDQRKDEFLAMLAHELRNPLGVISNAVYFLKSIQPEASDKVKEYLDIIETDRSGKKTSCDGAGQGHVDREGQRRPSGGSPPACDARAPVARLLISREESLLLSITVGGTITRSWVIV